MLKLCLLLTTYMLEMETKEIECHSCRISNYEQECSTTICIEINGCFTLQKANSSGITTDIEFGCLFDDLASIDNGCVCLDNGGYFCYKSCSSNLCNSVEDISKDFDFSQCLRTSTISTTTAVTSSTCLTTTSVADTTKNNFLRLDLILGLTVPISLGLMILIVQCFRK